MCCKVETPPIFSNAGFYTPPNQIHLTHHVWKPMSGCVLSGYESLAISLVENTSLNSETSPLRFWWRQSRYDDPLQTHLILPPPKVDKDSLSGEWFHIFYRCSFSYWCQSESWKDDRFQKQTLIPNGFTPDVPTTHSVFILLRYFQGSAYITSICHGLSMLWARESISSHQK